MYNLKKHAEPIIVSSCMQYPDKFAPNLPLTYIYFAIFHASRNNVFAHIIVIFVNMSFNKEGRILIRNLYFLKGYTAWMLLKEFPTKSWNKQSL